MKKNQKTKNKKNVQETQDQLNELLARARKINQELEESGKETRKKIAEIEAKVDKTTKELEEIFAGLDKAEKEAGDELDRLILEEAESLAKEEMTEEE